MYILCTLLPDSGLVRSSDHPWHRSKCARISESAMTQTQLSSGRENLDVGSSFICYSDLPRIAPYAHYFRLKRALPKILFLTSRYMIIPLLTFVIFNICAYISHSDLLIGSWRLVNIIYSVVIWWAHCRRRQNYLPDSFCCQFFLPYNSKSLLILNTFPQLYVHSYISKRYHLGYSSPLAVFSKPGFARRMSHISQYAVTLTGSLLNGSMAALSLIVVDLVLMIRLSALCRHLFTGLCNLMLILVLSDGHSKVCSSSSSRLGLEI